MDNQHRPRCLLPATTCLIRALGRRIRVEHAREVMELGWPDPATAALASFRQSLESWCCVQPGGSDAVFAMGVGRAGVATGGTAVWMLGSVAMDQWPLAVAKAGRWGVGRAFDLTGASYLEQFLPRWYRTGLRFVRWLGFEPVAGWHGDVVAVRLDRDKWLAGREGRGQKAGAKGE